MRKQRRNANQRRNAPPAPAGKLPAGERSPNDPFTRWLTVILALHVIGLTLYLISLRDSAEAESAMEISLTTPPPTERPIDPYAQAKFFDLVKQDPERLPVLPARRNPTDASSDIVLPDTEQVAELRKMEEESIKRDAEAEERLKNIRRERERMEAEAKAIAEAERKRVAAAERTRLKKIREAEEKKQAEALAAKKREQERRAKLKAEAEAKALAQAAAKAKADAAKAAAEAKARAARLADQNAANNSTGSGESSSGSSGGSGALADMGWYNSAVLGPAFFSAWNQPAGPDYTGENFSVSARITVRKDGRVIKAEIIRSSGNATVDASVRSALNRVTQLAPLPREYRQSTYSETINFALDS